MDTPPSNQTDFPPSEDPLEDPVDPDAPSPPPPSSSTTPPYPPEEPPPDNEPPPPKSPEMTPLPPENFFPSPSSPPPKIPTPSGNPQPVTPSSKPYNSPPPPFYDSGLSQSPPSPSFARTPPGGQLTPNPLILSPPSLSGVPLVPPGGPANSPNNVSGISESKVGTIDTTAVVATGLVSCFVLLGVIGMAVWWIWGGKKKVGPDRATRLGSSPQADSALFKMRTSSAYYSSEYDHESACETPGMGSAKNSYSYKELARATNEFSESNLLGEGGFGSVFKGLLPDGRKVAVKQLKDGGSQGEREFRAEVETISRIHHRHLVSLVGYCISDDKRLLVYDFVPNNTLYFHLHGKGVNFLDWPTRIKIATGAARGIAYLHEDCHPRIIHRDIKSSNILLDKNFEAQVSDFGLARFFSDLNTYVTTRVVGTFGYMAPEYASSGKLTEKSDVFSFGVVLLELITGRKPVDTSQPPGEESLVEWARPLLDYALDKEKFENLVDPRLGKNYVDSEMFQAIESATACVQYSDLKRPKMSRILRAFEDMTLSDDSNEIRGGQSETHESPRQSAEIRLFQRMAFGSQDFSTDFFTESDWKSEEK